MPPVVSASLCSSNRGGAAPISPEPESSPAAAARPSFLRRYSRKLAVLFVWPLLLGGYQTYAWRTGLTPLDTMHHLIDFMATSIFGALVYVALYAVCPLVLFPVGLLAVTAGFVFGPSKVSSSRYWPVTLLGASVEMSFAEEGDVGLNPWMLLASAIVLVCNLSLSRYLKRREEGNAR